MNGDDTNNGRIENEKGRPTNEGKHEPRGKIANVDQMERGM